MTTKERKEEPLEFLHRKVVVEGEWEVEIVDAFGKSVRAGPKGGINAPAPSEWEAEVKQRFVDEYSEAILTLDDVNDEYETQSFEWYWHIGEIAMNKLNRDEKGVNWSKFQEIISVDVLDDVEGDKYLENARKVYELIPDGDPQPYLPDGVEPHDRITAFAQIAQKSAFNSLEETREFLKNAAEADIKPTNRLIRSWGDVKDEEDPSLELIGECVVSRYKTYRNPETVAEKVERVYTLLGKEDETPERDEIISTIEPLMEENKD